MVAWTNIARQVVAILTLAAPAFCGNWYVDVVNGSDANNGQSWATAWKTMSHARATAPTGVLQTVHVAAGVYSAASGESFPIVVPNKFRFLGAGPSTIVRGASSETLFQFLSLISGNGEAIDPITVLQAMRLENASTGVEIGTDWNSAKPTLRNLEITGMASAGIRVWSANQFSMPTASPTIERVDVSQCNLGLGVSTVASSASPLQVRDSAFHENVVGVRFDQWFWAVALFERCRMNDNLQTGVSLGGGNFGGLDLELHDCLIAGNTNLGVHSNYSSFLNATNMCRAKLRGCTVVSNGVGVRVSNYQNDLETRDSILAENGDDIDVIDSISIVSVENTLIEDGDYATSPGNLSGDPQFVNAAGGDWRLRWASPCIDRPNAGSTASVTDLAGNPRTIDGDLDTLEVRDFGAFEFAPLVHVGEARIGTPLVLECSGPVSANATVYFSRRELELLPQMTPFGEFDLSPAQFGPFRFLQTGGTTPTIVQRSIPNSVALVGSTFSFQVLVDSPLAPAGAAYSNAVQITIVP